MSGIIGIVNLDGAPADSLLLERMTKFLAHRGPDGLHTWTSGPVGFGHTLLRTTMESATEHQPCSLDGQFCITADARVDGRTDLTAKLAAHGVVSLEVAPDALLILHAFRIWGDECVQHLLGDFAFAIWDVARQRLFCARDHFGVKPFFYARIGNCLIFSNTLDCVRVHPAVSCKLNDLAVADFLLFGTNQEQDTTTFANIRRLPPGHILTCSCTALAIRRYWTLEEQQEIHYRRPGDYLEHFNQLMDQAVADRLRTNKVSLFHSGGLDSATVAAAAVRLRASRLPSLSLQAHTAIYQRFIPDREREYADLVASALQIPIEYLVADEMVPFAWLDESEAPSPEPNDELIPAVTMHLMRRMVAHGPVALDGNGGDEALIPPIGPAYWLFLFRSFRIARFLREAIYYVLQQGRLPPIGFRYWVRRLLRTRRSKPSAFPTWLNSDLVSQLHLSDRWEQGWQTWFESQYATSETRVAARFRLTNPLIAGMFESCDAGRTNCPLEVRFPFFDLRLVAFLLAIPPVPWCFHKVLLRKALHGQVPEAICRRPKTPLAADPLMGFFRLVGVPPLDLPAIVPELRRFVDVQALTPAKLDGEADEIWQGLRPRKLNAWLRTQGRLQFRQDSLLVNCVEFPGGSP